MCRLAASGPSLMKRPLARARALKSIIAAPQSAGELASQLPVAELEFFELAKQKFRPSSRDWRASRESLTLSHSAKAEVEKSTGERGKVAKTWTSAARSLIDRLGSPIIEHQLAARTKYREREREREKSLESCGLAERTWPCVCCCGHHRVAATNPDRRDLPRSPRPADRKCHNALPAARRAT